MASSALSGERRWGSTRRGGMTVLGKVAVPKPVNLPSQRLENHGLDPNVEIVPKGTLSWGSRSSSSSQNAWGSPASPNTDGSNSSPNRLNDRPSSGGSGTRPSTAGSDKSHEPVPNMWVSGSRPSSASGVLASNKTLAAAARPRSAETRPGSSQLSRFAEPLPENSVARGASRTSDKLGASSFKSDGFTLSSGDFPTLGSEKNAESDVRNGNRSQERPLSASGRVATPRERLENFQKEDESSIDAARNTWKKDNSPYVGAPPSTDKWRMETQSYPDSIMNPQQFGPPWHGTSVHNSPDGVWYRGGPPGGPPYRPPGPPGNYPLEPFAYYHPRVPAQPPANMQTGPRAVSGPSGYHASNGNSYRPHMPEPYMQPVMPVRPGAYPVQVPYEGYYGPPRAGFCNPSDRDAPGMGMGTGPCVYNRYPVQNAHPESGNIHTRYDATNMVLAKEQGEPSQPHGTHPGPYKVLLKQHDSWEDNDGKEKREHAVNEQHRKGSLPGSPMIELRADRNDEPVVLSKVVSSEEASSHSFDAWGGYSSIPVNSSLPESANNDKAANDSLARKPKASAIPGEAPQKNLSTKRNPTLIEKIDGLNNKVRNFDARHDVGHISIKDEKLKPFGVLNAKTDNDTKNAGSGIVSAEKASNSGTLAPTHEMVASAEDEKIETMSARELQAPAISVSSSSECGGNAHSYNQKRPQGHPGRTDYRGRGKFKPQEGDEWRKKPLVANTSIESSSKIFEPSSDKHVLEYSAAEVMLEESDMNIQGEAGGELYAKSAFDPSDHKVQRVKMREIAAQRAKQLQKEEEERIREQKAKALAKLEELNRRTLTESSTEKLDNSLPPSRTVLNRQEEAPSNADPPLASSSGTLPSSSLGCNSNADSLVSDKNSYKLGESTEPPKQLRQEALPCAAQDPIVTHKSPVPSPEENSENGTDQKTAQIHDSSVSKQRQMSYIRKQSTNKNLHDRSSSVNYVDTKDHGIVNTSSGESNWPSNTNGSDDLSLQHKKKNNRSGKNKQRLDVAFTPLLVPVEEIVTKASDEVINLRSSNSLLEVTTVQELNSSDNTDDQNSQAGVQFTEQGWTMPTEETNIRSKHQSKPARWMPRNSQTTKTDTQHNGDNVVWAPVRSLNKNEASDRAVCNTSIEARSSPGNGYEAQNSQKSKRAEMERYVPKPVVKELSQQGNTQQPSSSSVNQVVSNENTGRANPGSLGNEISEPDGSANGKGGFAATSKNGENKHNKHGKAHGLWRQRGSVDSSTVTSVEGSSYSSDPSKAVQQPIRQHRSTKPETYLSKEQAKHPENSNAPNSSMSIKPSSGEVVPTDQVATGRGRRQASKGHKGMEQNLNNSDYKDLHGGGTTETGNSPPELNQLVGRNISGESHGVGAQSSSHWQPKSQAFVDHNQQVSKGNGGQKVVKASQKDYAPQGGKNLPSKNDNVSSSSLVQSHSDGSDTQKAIITGAPNMRCEDAKSEKKVVDSSKDGDLLPDQHLSKADEHALPENINNQHGQSFSSGFHRHGHVNGRFGRGQEMSRGSRNSGGQEGSKQVHTLSNNDRRKHNSHYEYHPTRSHNTDPNESFDEGSRARGARYREKGQSHSRHVRETFYERGSSNVQVTVSYDNNSHYEYHPTRSHNTDPNESFDEGSRARGARYREKGQSHSRHVRETF